MKNAPKSIQTLSFVSLLIVSALLSTFAYRYVNVSYVAFRDGETLWEKGRVEDAQKAFRTAASAGQLRPGMALKLARAAFLAGDEATGRAVLDSLVDSQSKLTPYMLHTAAGIYDQYGMPGKALNALSRAGEAVLSSEPTATYLAELKARAGDIEGAEELYRKVMTTYPGDTGASLGLAQLLAWSGRIQAAEDICRPVLERDPGNRQARIVLGRILTAAGRFEEAITEYRKALEKTP